jgi:hypothetical protein
MTTQKRGGVLKLGAALLDTFGYIQIISLKERVDRRKDIALELNRLGLSVGQPGVDILDASQFSEAAGFRTSGARGCFDSHLRAITRARDIGARSTLILEDDCDFSPGIERIMPIALDAILRTDWSIFYGGYLRWVGEKLSETPIVLAQSSDAFLGSHFIALSSEALNLAIPYLKAMRERPAGSADGGPMDIDGAYGWFRAAHPRLQTWVAEPVLGTQRSSRTDIRELGWFDRTRGVRDVTALLRRVRRAVKRRL